MDMKRTNIYLDDRQLRMLKHLAVEEGNSFTELVRRAIAEFLERRSQSPHDWDKRLRQLLTALRRRAGRYQPAEIEADVTAAVKESRRRRAHAARRH
jgi:hypothetical protein